MDHEDTLRAMYAAFNARDTDAVLATMAPDVAWPKAFEGGHVSGQPEVRAYWARQWTEIDPTVMPVAFAHEGDGVVAVTVDQVVKDLNGDLIGEGQVVHRYAFDEDGLVARMDVEER